MNRSPAVSFGFPQPISAKAHKGSEYRWAVGKMDIGALYARLGAPLTEKNLLRSRYTQCPWVSGRA